MNHLHRELAPIGERAWSAIDDEARARLEPQLAARRVVDFDGPTGWSSSSSSLERTVAIDGPSDGVGAVLRSFAPVLELRVAFELDRGAVDDAERGVSTPDFDAISDAAAQIASAENLVVLGDGDHGGIRGIAAASSHEHVALPPDVATYPTTVASAADTLRRAGVSGPFALLLSPQLFTAIAESTEHGGVMLLDHLRAIVGGPLVWGPGVEGGLLLSLRGGDFSLQVTDDLSIGYLDHDADVVRLYLQEALSFRVLEPDAAVVLTARA